MTIQNQTTFESKNNIIYAGVLKRMGANLIDKFIYLLMGILILVGQLAILWLVGLFNPEYTSSLSDDILVLAIFLWLILIIIYRVFLETGKKRATWGMQAMNIQIVSDQGENITKKQSLIRTCAFGVLSIIPVYEVILMFMIIFRVKKQGLHDLLTKTYIIQKN